MRHRASRRLAEWLVVLTLLTGCDGGGTAVTFLPDEEDIAIDVVDANEPDVETIDGDLGDVIEVVPDDVTPDLQDDPAEPFVAEGKRLLAQGQSGRARDAFQAGIDQSSDSVDARFGLALSEMVYGAELFVMSTSLIGQLTAGRSSGNEPSHDAYVAAQMQRILLETRAPFVRAADLLEGLADDTVRFEVEAVPVFLGLKPRLLYRGTFDEGDALLMRAVASGLIGILDTLAGQDLTTSLLTGVSLVQDAMAQGGLDAPLVLKILAYFLNEDVRFLTLEPVEGPLLFVDARARFGTAGRFLVQALDRIEALGAGDDEVSWVDLTSGGVVLRVRSGVEYDAAGVAVEKVLSFDVSEATRQAFVDSSNSILEPGRPITLHAGVLPVLVTMVAALAKTGVLEVLGLDLSLNLAALAINDVLSLLTGMLPNVLAFDWGAFYEVPVGLRTWLPVTTASNEGLMQDLFEMEWECPEDLQADGFPTGWQRILCAEDAVCVDAPHFQEHPDAIAADGKASRLPVFRFPDPTLSSLLQVDLNGVDGGADASTYQPATSQSLNRALDAIVEGWLPLLPD